MEGWGIKIRLGILMLAAWLFSQSVHSLFVPVYANIVMAAHLSDSGYLMLAAFWLVAVNAFRVVLLYDGWFLLAEGTAQWMARESLAWGVPLAAIPASYMAAEYFHPASVLHFGVPALLSLAGIGLLRFFSRGVSRASYRLIVQSVLVVSMQWLDVIPLLTPYGFGWGELSLAVKDLAALMERAHLLNTLFGAFFGLNVCVALLLTEVFVGYEKRLAQLRLLRARERELNQLRHQQLQARLYQEMQYLVHDLKRPLTAVVGLADLLSLSRDPATVRHSRTILSAAEKMDQMISEIRDPSRVRTFPAEELLLFTLAQVRPLAWGDRVSADYGRAVAEKRIRGNLIRLSRALVNLLDNAHHATAGLKEPLILLRAAAQCGGIALIVEDNGPGFIQPRNAQGSSWGSTGLGLAFVKSVVSASLGVFTQEARPGGGLVSRIWIPAEEDLGDRNDKGGTDHGVRSGDCG